MSRSAGDPHTLDAPTRLLALRRLELLDRPSDPALGRLIALAVAVLDAPVALLSLVDDRRQFFTAAHGLPEPWASRRETPLTHSFCQYVVRAGAALVVDDARAHPLVHDNLGIAELGVEAYLGQPIWASDGSVLGSLAVADRRPRVWTAREVGLLELLAEVATREVVLGQATRTTAAVLEHASDAYVTLDAQHRVTGCNAAAERLIGEPRAALVGRPASEVFPEALARAVEPVMDRALRDGAVFETEVRAVLPGAAPLGDGPRRDGRGEQAHERAHERAHEQAHERALEVRVLPARDGAALLARDVTARQQAEEERTRLLDSEHRARLAAEDANRAKSDFLAVMSHELRTPLNAIAGHVQLVEMEIHGPVSAAQRDALARVQRAQRHLLGLIDDLLQYAKLEAGKVEFDVAATRVDAVLEDVLPLIEPQAAARGVTVRVRADDAAGRGLVWADAGKLSQVVLNLLSNAVKFSPPGAAVDVELADCEGAPDRVELRVRDAGVGIPAERQATVFEPFVQVGRALNQPKEGTGLGLAISRDLARGMGGDVRLRSAEGAGSTFAVVLRRVADESGAPTDRRARTERRAHHERRGGGERRRPPS